MTGTATATTRDLAAQVAALTARAEHAEAALARARTVDRLRLDQILDLTTALTETSIALCRVTGPTPDPSLVVAVARAWQPGGRIIGSATLARAEAAVKAVAGALQG